MHAKARDAKWGDMEWQHRNWYSFVWICGDQIVEQHYHNIDFMNWVMGAHPVKVVASGGVAWRPKEELYGNIYDHMSAEFVYPNGVHLDSHCRQYPARVPQRERPDRRRQGPDQRPGPRHQGHESLRAGAHQPGAEHPRRRPVPEPGDAGRRGTMTCIMARESAYSGLEITWDMIMNSKQDLQPKAFDYKLAMDVPPLPVPGKYKFI